jgi:hypothetical protein
MKKELIYYSILTLVIAILLFFETNIFDHNRKYISKVIEIESFQKLDIDLACNIYVSLGDEQKVVFEGPKKFLDRLETRMEDGVLKISCRKRSLFAEFFKTEEDRPETLNLYIKLTNTNQLITPKKGNLISNETSLYLEIEKCESFSLGQDLKKILKLVGDQRGIIAIQ